MTSLLLSSPGEWVNVALVVGGLFVGALVLVSVYSFIEDKTKIEDKDGCGWPIFLVIVAVIIGVLINMKNCSCKGHHENNYDPSNEYWENTPRHT